MFCTVVTASKAPGIGNGLTYELPDGMTVEPGMLVRVPLRNKLTEGVVIDVLSKPENEEFDVKQVKEVLHSLPLLTFAQIQTVRWMADHYMTTLRQALGVWLPAGDWAGVLPKETVFYRLLRNTASELRSKKQQAVLEFLDGKDWVPLHTVRNETGVSPAILKALIEKGYIETVLRRPEMSMLEENHASHLKSLPELTDAQQHVERAMRDDPRPSLLFGVTGSGKTEIYAQLIADTIKRGKQAIVLVPEILLTEHSIHRYEALLDRSAIAVVHSRLTEAARRTLWRRILRGEVALVLGSRSALFSPVRNLGLVIIDEEHEWTFKNEQTPRYHARETAEALCQHTHAKLVMGSATPSLESWQRARESRYQLERLPMRYKEQAMPDVKIIDLAQVKFGSMYPFSPPLLDAIEDRLKKGEQSVLFLNRRGVATSLLCLDCRRRVVSPESLLPFTVHVNSRGKPYLLDHTSGLLVDVPALCPSCSSARLHPIGAGTQKVEHLLQKRFPHARLLRADADTLSSPEQMRDMLSRMRNREADILLGTQSVVKGLDLPEVTLAAVVLADVGISLPHFRAGERVFQLLTQLTGRSGRAKAGEVIIQTFRPSATEILAASKHETEQYLDMELKLRAHTGYPPAKEMVRLIVRDNNPADRARSLTAKLQEKIDALAASVSAKCAPTFFGGGREWHVLLRGEHIRDVLNEISLESVVVDVDPMETV